MLTVDPVGKYANHTIFSIVFSNGKIFVKMFVENPMSLYNASFSISK